jgi:hypothetical protein
MSINIESGSQYNLAQSMAVDRSKEKLLEEKLKSRPATDEELMEVCKGLKHICLSRS